MGHRDTVAEMTALRLPVQREPAATDGAPDHAEAPEPETAPPRSLLRRFGWLIALALIGVGVAGWQIAGGGEAPAHFATATAEIATIEDIVSATGTVQPLEYVDVGTQVTGQLSKLHVTVGEVVKKGQLVAEIDPIVFESKVATGRAQLQNLHAQLREREAQAKLADLLRERNRKLRTADAVSEEVEQQTDAAAVQAHAQVDAIRAQIQQALSSLSGDEANLRYTRIYAPMGGTVVTLNARQGQTLVSSQQAPVILRIADLSTMTVWAQVSEADVPRVSVGMPVYFNTLGLPDRRWKGQVRQVLPTPDTVNNVVLYNVLFDVANPDGALRPQMSAQVFFRVASAEDAVSIPPAALQAPARVATPGAAGKGKGKAREKPHEPKYVVRVLRDGKVEERAVTVGLQTRMQVHVTSGLAAGEEVVPEGAPKAKAKKAPALAGT